MTFAKFLDPNPNKFDYFECTKYLLMTCEVQNIMQGTSKGLVVILDAAGLTFGHLAGLNLIGLKKILFYIQEAIPVRLKGLHILNTMPIVDTLVNLIKPFMKKELMNLVSQRYYTHIKVSLLFKKCKI